MTTTRRGFFGLLAGLAVFPWTKPILAGKRLDVLASGTVGYRYKFEFVNSKTGARTDVSPLFANIRTNPPVFHGGEMMQTFIYKNGELA